MKILQNRPIWLVPLVAALVLMAAKEAPAQTASQLYAESVEAYKQGKVDLAKHKLQLTLEADKNFRPATALLSRIASEQSTAGVTTSAATVPARSLERMVVPVEFKDTSLQSALEYLRQHIASGSGGKLQVNFVLNLPPELANKRVTLQLDHVPVTEILRYVGAMVGVNFEFQKYAILVTPATGAAAPLDSRAPVAATP